MNIFVALAIGGAEVTTPGYTRRPTTLAYAYDGATLCNIASIQWPVAAASWGVIDTVLIYDAQTSGTLIATLPTVTPIEIRQYDIARIPASGIAMVLTQAARAFGTGKFGTSVYAARKAYGPAIAHGVFGARGLGAADGTPGVFSGRGYDIPFRGVMAAGVFGPEGYGAAGGVPLERVFDDQHACAARGWMSPGDCSSGVWAPPPDCPVGAWARAA